MPSGNNQLYLTVPGAAMTKAEREYIKLASEYICKTFDDPIMVNLGVMWGASMHCLRAGCKDAILVGVDTNFSHKIQHIDALQPIIWVALDSAEAGHNYDNEIHLLFVDADHRYEAVKKDIEAWTPHIVPGGLIIFHDYAPAKVDLDRDPGLAGVNRAVNEWYTNDGILEEQWIASSTTGLPDPPDSLFITRKLNV